MEPEDYTGKFTNHSFTQLNTKKSKKQEIIYPRVSLKLPGKQSLSLS